MPLTPATVSATSPLDEEARHLLASFEPVVDALAALFGPGCEVVLHAFDNLHASVIKIANGHVTGRKKGAPVTDFALSRITALEGEAWSSYFTRTRDGGLMKSASVTLRSRSGQAVGMLCVNFSRPFGGGSGGTGDGPGRRGSGPDARLAQPGHRLPPL